MIARVSGTLLECDLTGIVVDVHGVGLAVSVPMSTFDKLPVVGSPVTLFTHLHVREDNLTLYGFSTTSERQLFLLLINTVSGIGPKLALNVLSCLPVDAFCRHIVAGDIKALSRVNGIGKRTAERLVVELRDRIGEIDPSAVLTAAAGASPLTREAQDAIAALETLGFKTDMARRTVQQVAAELPESQQRAEALIRKALQVLNS